MLFFPEFAIQLWGCPNVNTYIGRLLVRSIGYFLLSHGVSVLVLCQGGGMANAIGLSALAVAVSLAGLIVTGQFDNNVPNPKEPAYPWILLLLAIANSLLGGGAVGTGSV